MDEILQLAEQIQDGARRCWTKLVRRIAGRRLADARRHIGGSLLALVVLLAWSAWLISRSISRPLHDAINVLTTSASQIATATVRGRGQRHRNGHGRHADDATVAEVKQTALTAVQKAKYVADAAQQTAQASRQRHAGPWRR